MFLSIFKDTIEKYQFIYLYINDVSFKMKKRYKCIFFLQKQNIGNVIHVLF